MKSIPTDRQILDNAPRLVQWAKDRGLINLKPAEIVRASETEARRKRSLKASTKNRLQAATPPERLPIEMDIAPTEAQTAMIPTV